MAGVGQNNLQLAAVAKEEAKLAYKRKMNEERRLRILNAKHRTIGVDVQALDAQIEEKRRNKDNDSDIAKLEKMQAMEIERLLAASLEEERQMKIYQMNEMKRSWEQSIDYKNKLKNETKQPDVDFDNLGASSLQRFKGEDPDKFQRIKALRAQTSTLLQEQMAEKNAKKQMDAEDSKRYAEMIKAIDEIREQNEREEYEMKKFLLDNVRRENAELAQNQRDRRKVEKIDPNSTSLNIFNEDQLAAYNEKGKINRVDMFRGFTFEQRNRIFKENEAIIREKMERAQGEKRKEYDWLLHQTMALRAMEQAEFEEKQIAESNKNYHLNYLKHQMDEQAKNRAEWDKNKKGGIDNGFFEGFGRDCR